MSPAGTGTAGVPTRGPRPAGSLARSPLALVALVTLVVNDHVAKARWHDTVTGKASDVAGLVLVPLLAASALELALAAIAGRRDGRRPVAGRGERGTRAAGAPTRALVAGPGVAGLAVVTGIAFAATKVWAPAADAYRMTFGALQWAPAALADLMGGRTIPELRPVSLVADRSDLWALVALTLPVWIGSGRTRAWGGTGDAPNPPR